MHPYIFLTFKFRQIFGVPVMVAFLVISALMEAEFFSSGFALLVLIVHPLPVAVCAFFSRITEDCIQLLLLSCFFLLQYCEICILPGYFASVSIFFAASTADSLLLLGWLLVRCSNFYHLENWQNSSLVNCISVISSPEK